MKKTMCAKKALVFILFFYSFHAFSSCEFLFKKPSEIARHFGVSQLMHVTEESFLSYIFLDKKLKPSSETDMPRYLQKMDQIFLEFLDVKKSGYPIFSSPLMKEGVVFIFPVEMLDELKNKFHVSFGWHSGNRITGGSFFWDKKKDTSKISFLNRFFKEQILRKKEKRLEYGEEVVLYQKELSLKHLEAVWVGPGRRESVIKFLQNTLKSQLGFESKNWSLPRKKGAPITLETLGRLFPKKMPTNYPKIQDPRDSKE